MFTISNRIKGLLSKLETHGTTGLGALLLAGIFGSGLVDVSNVDTVAMSHYVTQLLDSISGIEQSLSSIKFGQLSLGAAASILLFRHRAPSPPKE